MEKKIHLYHLTHKLHSATQLMVRTPPKGYKFVLQEKKLKQKIFEAFFNSKLIKTLYRKFFKKIVKPSLKSNSIDIPKNIDLVFSTGLLLDIKSPWIVEIMDHPASLAGYDFNLFMKHKNEIEKNLLSAYCKRIIAVNEASFKLMRKYFNSKVNDKTVLIRAAVEKPKLKKVKKEKIRIIFIGSISNPEDFYIKGGLEALEAFKRVSEEIKNVEFFVRCKVPDEIVKKYENVRGLKILNKSLGQNEWKNLMQSVDICLNPGHVYPLMATLESMSYGIPIIMLDTYGVRDYLTNGKNAILVKPSDKITGYKSKEYPLNIRSKEFIEEIKQMDKQVIERLSAALKKLILNQNLREKLGKNARRDVEKKFSIELRNKKLKKVFDDAVKNI